MVGIASPEERAHAYPHELSGGMLQRVMIAMAMASEPKLLIADEPTTALDVTIQAQILELIRSLASRFDMATMLITHDMGVIAAMADRVLVMYAGQVVEEGKVAEVFHAPQHPYTKLLLECVPTVGAKRDVLPAIEGIAPAIGAFPRACRFHPRCPERMDRCETEAPGLLESDASRARCWLADSE